MIWVNSSSSTALTAGAVVPLDTVVCSTNDNVKLSGNALQVTVPGWCVAGLDMILASTAGGTVTIQMNEQGNPVSGAAQTVIVPANGTQTVSMEWPVHVISSASGVASINWTTNADVTVTSAVASIMAVI